MYDPFSVRLSGAGAALALPICGDMAHGDDGDDSMKGGGGGGGDARGRAESVGAGELPATAAGRLGGTAKNRQSASEAVEGKGGNGGREESLTPDHAVVRLAEESPGEGCGALTSAERSAGGRGALRFYTVHVPTAFTTADGRPIVIREERLLPADSAYVQMLQRHAPRGGWRGTKRHREEEEEEDGDEEAGQTSSPSQRAVVASLSPSAHVDQQRCDFAFENDSPAAASAAWRWKGRSISQQWGGPLVLPAKLRSKSCPPPALSGAKRSPEEEEEEGRVVVAGAESSIVDAACMYTGFTRADGRMIFHSSEA